jgi:hypothetical protein
LFFSGAEFNIQNSKQSYFIQIADFVATLGYILMKIKNQSIVQISRFASTNYCKFKFLPK